MTSSISAMSSSPGPMWRRMKRSVGVRKGARESVTRVLGGACTKAVQEGEHSSEGVRPAPAPRPIADGYPGGYPGADDRYNSDPLEYDPASNTIEIDIATAGQQINGNDGIDNIVVIFQEPVTPNTPDTVSETDRNVVRGKLVNILPGQTNIIRINLSTLAR